MENIVISVLMRRQIESVLIQEITMVQAEQECMEITQMPTLDSITEEELYLLTLNFLGRIRF